MACHVEGDFGAFLAVDGYEHLSECATYMMKL